MAEQIQLDTNVITITPLAAEKVKALLEEKDLTGYGLRVFVSGGGCSGLQYGMAFENDPRENDTVSDAGDVRIIVDPVSLDYLRGANIDYVDTLMGGGFSIENPNAVSSCGCGNSFRTDDSQGGASQGGSCGCH